MTSRDVADLLKTNKLIRSDWAFQWYIRIEELRNQIQAGTYSISQSQSVPQIANILTRGKVSVKLVTILPDRRLDQVRSDLVNSGFLPADVDQALNPSNYSGLSIMDFKPVSANLEGLLYPDSFQKNSATSPESIIKESLSEMNQHMTPQLKTSFSSKGLSVYQGIILASMVQQEVSEPKDQFQVAQVFIKRLNMNMPLGSDQTAFYGSIVDGRNPSIAHDSPYNTLLHTGLPPTPISNVNDQSLNAVAHPANTNWLYFVTGDNGVTYYSTTLAEHTQQTQQYCQKLCSSE